MEPLSVAASLIAVVQGLTASGQLFSKLMQLRKASSEYQALFNEVEALRGLLLIVKTALVRIEGSSLYDEVREAVHILLSSVQDAVLELHSMVEYDLGGGEGSDKQGMPRVSKTAWLKSGGKLQRLREKIRDSRSNLVAGMSALNLCTVVEVERHAAVQVQSIRMLTDREPAVPICDPLSSEPECEQRTLTAQTKKLGLKEGRRVDIPDKAKGTICVTTTMASRQCSPSCKCSCHNRTQGQTPGWLRSAVGQLMFNYTALLQVKACDYPPCRKDSQKSRFTYYFPQWMASRALMVSGDVNDLSGVGACWSIKMPTVIPANDRVWWIVRHGNLQALQKLFQHDGYNPWVINEFGTTLLHRAVNSGRFEAYNFLVSVGAQQSSEEGTRGNRTAQAMALSTTEYRSYSLDGEAVAEELDFTAVHLAVALPSSERPLTEQMLKRQYESINARDRNGMTPLSWACRRGDIHATELLIDWSADVNSQDKLGRCALHHASYACDYACVAALLEAGAEANLADLDGHTALSYLSHRGVALVDLLVKYGANVNHRDQFGWTPAHQAAQGDDNDELIAQLLRNGADATVQNHNGWTAIHHAVAFDCPDILSLLVGTERTVRKKIRRTSVTNLPRSLTVRTDSGNTINSMLSFACRSTGSRRSRQLMLSPVQTSSSVWTSTEDGDTVLHLAGRHAGTEVMTVLARADLHGLDPDQRSRRGSTPDDCFYQHRDEDLLVERSPSEQAEKAWEDLMTAVMQQNGLIGRVEPLEDTGSPNEVALTHNHGEQTLHREKEVSKIQCLVSEAELEDAVVLDDDDDVYMDTRQDSSKPLHAIKGHMRFLSTGLPSPGCVTWDSPCASPSLIVS